MLKSALGLVDGQTPPATLLDKIEQTYAL